MAGAKLGDRKAVQALAKKCNDRFLAHGWRLTGDKEAARDITQQAWVEIMRSLPKLKDDHMFLPWGYRIVTRTAAGWIKRQQRRRNLSEALEFEAGNPPETEDVDSRIALQGAIASLPTDQQAALALFYREGLTIAEMSVALDIPPGTVKSRLSLARNKLHNILERE